MPPRSSSLANSIQYSSLRLVADLSLGFYRHGNVNVIDLFFFSLIFMTNLPLPRRQMTNCRHVKGIQEDLLLVTTIGIAISGRGRHDQISDEMQKVQSNSRYFPGLEQCHADRLRRYPTPLYNNQTRNTTRRSPASNQTNIIKNKIK